jgi:hypothetical protein
VYCVFNRGGRPCIVEYSEVTAENTTAVDSSTGKLLYGAGNICNHYYTLQYVQQVAVPALAQGGSVAYHVAHKQVCSSSVTRPTHCTIMLHFCVYVHAVFSVELVTHSADVVCAFVQAVLHATVAVLLLQLVLCSCVAGSSSCDDKCISEKQHLCTLLTQLTLSGSRSTQACNNMIRLCI